MVAISYRQRDWFHGTIKENKGITDSIVVRLDACIFMQSEEQAAANSELCKAAYDEAWHENTCQIGLCD